MHKNKVFEIIKIIWGRGRSRDKKLLNKLGIEIGIIFLKLGTGTLLIKSVPVPQF